MLPSDYNYINPINLDLSLEAYQSKDFEINCSKENCDNIKETSISCTSNIIPSNSVGKIGGDIQFKFESKSD
jgi:hypothetical protein